MLHTQLFTTALKRFFITSNLLSAEDQTCGKFWFSCQWKKWAAWFCCLL